MLLEQLAAAGSQSLTIELLEEGVRLAGLEPRRDDTWHLLRGLEKDGLASFRCVGAVPPATSPANQEPERLPADYPICAFGVLEEQHENWVTTTGLREAVEEIDSLRILIGPHPAFVKEMKAIQMLVEGYCLLNERIAWVRSTIDAMDAEGAWKWKGQNPRTPQLPSAAAALLHRLWNEASERSIMDDALSCLGALGDVLQHNPQLAEVSRQMTVMNDSSAELLRVMCAVADRKREGTTAAAAA